MSTINKQEYLKLIKQLLEEQYDDKDPSEEENHWIPAESPLKDRIPLSVQSGTVDLTNAKKDRIRSSLFTFRIFKVDNFMVKTERRQTATVPITFTYDIEIFEERFKTPSGNPCRMTYHLDVVKDSRFSQCPWITQFGGCSARSVSTETFVDIIRWMQALNRLTCFL